MSENDSKFLIKLIIAGLVIVMIVLIWSFVKTRTEYESFKEDLSMRTRNLEAKDEYLEREVKKLKEDTNELELDIRRSRGAMDKDMVRRIDSYLEDTDMAGLGEKIVIEAELYGIDPRIAPVVAAAETDCGEHSIPGQIDDFGYGYGKDDDAAREARIEYFFDSVYRHYGEIQEMNEYKRYAYNTDFFNKWIQATQVVMDSI